LDYFALTSKGPLLLRIAENLANLWLIRPTVSLSSSNLGLLLWFGEGEGEGVRPFDLDFEEPEYLSFSLSRLRLFRKVGMRCSLLAPVSSLSLYFGGVTFTFGLLIACEYFRLCKNLGERPPLRLFAGLKMNSTTLDASLLLNLLTSLHRHSPFRKGWVISAILPDEDLK
jgi:hypothetical protein